MKLLNQSSRFLSLIVLLVMAIWSAIFYFFMIEVIHDSIDEELENQKRLIIRAADSDSSVLLQSTFDVGHYAISELPKDQALLFKDTYVDGKLPMQDGDDPATELESVRVLTTVFEKDGHYYKLKMVNSMIEEDDLAKNLFYSLFILYALVVASVIIVNNSVLKKVWTPFYRLLHQFQNYRLGSTSKFPSVHTKTQEFIDLQSSINVLLQHSQEAYEQQKIFIENASHELLTPLAIIQNKLELLIEKSDLQAEQADAIVQVYNEVEKMVRLNKSLLLLTKIKNKHFFDNQTVHINEMVKQYVDNLNELSQFKKHTIRLIETAELHIDSDKSLLTILFSNLIRNALNHNVGKKETDIEITSNAFKITNYGNEPLPSDKLFNRFHKGVEASSGTGLGLAIVKAICDLYQFQIEYSFQSGMHTFEVTFKS